MANPGNSRSGRDTSVLPFPERPFTNEEGVFLTPDEESQLTEIIRLFGIEDPATPKIPFYIEGGTVSVRGEFCQWTGAFPEERVIDGIALIIPGYGGFKKTSRGLRNALAERGIPTISYEPLRDSNASIWENLTSPQDLHVQTVATVMDSVRDDKRLHGRIPDGFAIDYESGLLLPHSMGGLAATPYAKENPKRVDAIIFLATVGFGSPTLGQLALAVPAGLSASLSKEMIPYLTSGNIDLSPSNLFKAVQYFYRRPDRALGEMISCLTSDVSHAMDTLREHEIKTIYLAMKHDILVPEIKHARGLMDLVAVVENMGHMGPQAKAQKLAGLIVDVCHQQPKAA